MSAILALPCAVGFAVIVAFIYRSLRFLSFHLWTSKRPLKQYQDPSKESSWAFITGSSAGIGYGFAHALILAGFNVIIHSHRLDELQSAAESLKALRPGAKVEIIHLDAMGFDAEELARSMQRPSKLPISILVNNVGGLTPRFQEIAAYTAHDMDMMLDLNVRFTTHVTQLLMPVLLSQPRAVVINLSSGARLGLPLLPLYSSAKAYVDTLSHCIDREARIMGHNIRSISIAPGDVISQANHFGPFPALTPTAQEYARNAVRKMDAAISRGMLRMHPDWTHELQDGIAAMLPESLLTRAMAGTVLSKQARHEEYLAKSR
ncbi:uncharacterized protein B0I36DRAFT_330404 [Microdochium trichocladiopsis]|uniref:Uncharacterized protein n=1 Tax=Microdochium trichocladiopsis TaxID=1682393 RepID=A0A9P8Y354_9PEZI|nr:uncharacterized protein B0I36DRAFT_330404 [Microdochium trichocladiopsis]KAH7026332.1 hypothetical protein B0I36DRAFT_330404 [Microdochium trichocladiopsis]